MEDVSCNLQCVRWSKVLDSGCQHELFSENRYGLITASNIPYQQDGNLKLTRPGGKHLSRVDQSLNHDEHLWIHRGFLHIVASSIHVCYFDNTWMQVRYLLRKCKGHSSAKHIATRWIRITCSLSCPCFCAVLPCYFYLLWLVRPRNYTSRLPSVQGVVSGLHRHFHHQYHEQSWRVHCNANSIRPLMHCEHRIERINDIHSAIRLWDFLLTGQWNQYWSALRSRLLSERSSTW